MSKLSGAVLVLAGLGIAAYTVTFSGGGSTVAAGPEQPSKQDAGQSPAGGELHVGAVAEVREPAKIVPPVPVPAVAPRPTVPPLSTAVALPPRRMPVAQTDAAFNAPLDRAGLAREIQRHLKRVGCYGGDVTGVWTPAARRSMKTFTDRVNATLPIDDPDYVLLAMVESYRGTACGRGCPAGESEAEDGRCLPKGLVAQGVRKSPGADPSIQARGANVAALPLPSAADAPPAPLPQGRMALAGPPAIEEPAAVDGRKGDSLDKRRSDTKDNRRYSDTRDRGRPARGMNRLPNWATTAFGNSP